MTSSSKSTPLSSSATDGTTSPATKDFQSFNGTPVRFGSETDRLGTERVGFTPVREWDTHANEAAGLVEKCEALYQKIQA
jgi:hypothetical protein